MCWNTERVSIAAVAVLLSAPILLSAAGCSIEYYDTRQGVEHVWGITHMAMKADAGAGGIRAIGRRTDIAGLSLGKGPDGYHLDLGLSSYQQIDIVDQNMQLCLAWPAGSFYQAHAGSDFPPDLGGCSSDKRRSIDVP